MRVVVIEIILAWRDKVVRQNIKIKRHEPQNAKPLHAVEIACIEQNRFASILQEQCFEIENHVNIRDHRFIMEHFENQIYNRVEQVRDTHFIFKRRL